MRELKYVYIVEFRREHWSYTEYEFIGVYRRHQDALAAKADYLKKNDGVEAREVYKKKHILQ